MKLYSIFLILPVILVNLSFAESIYLSGKINNLAGYPVVGADISLLNSGLTTTSNDSGLFVFDDSNVSIINNIQNSSQLALFGNQLSIAANQHATLTIFSLSGAKLLEKTIGERAGENVVSLDHYFNNLANGLFILQIQGENSNISIKVVKNARTITMNKVRGFNRYVVEGGSTNERRSRAVDTICVVVDGDELYRFPLTKLTDSSIVIELDLLPDVFTEKINAIPDYYQQDTAYGGFNDGGRVFCGPTAISNSLMWLTENGYPKLADTTSDRKKAQHDMIALLASSNYMNLGSGGVGPWGVCDGIKAYFETSNVKYKSLEYQGHRSIADEYYTGIKIPSMEWIKKGLMKKGSVWFNFGWYTYNEATDTYTRNGGHWMTMAGYGFDGISNDSMCLIVHDPGYTTFNEYIKLEKIESGTMNGNDASGYYKFKNSSYIWGILDGVVVLNME